MAAICVSPAPLSLQRNLHRSSNFRGTSEQGVSSAKIDARLRRRLSEEATC
jgi:hypothetical protein